MSTGGCWVVNNGQTLVNAVCERPLPLDGYRHFTLCRILGGTFLMVPLSLMFNQPFLYDTIKHDSMHKIQLVSILEKSSNYFVGQCHKSPKRHLRRPHFSKGLTKLAIRALHNTEILSLLSSRTQLVNKCSGLICLALPARQKFGLILVIKFFIVEVIKKSS